MKKRYILSFLLLVFLAADMRQVQAETALKSESVEISGAERYDAEYYAEPELRYPVKQKSVYGPARAAELSLEEYIVAALENFETVIDVSSYNIPISQGSQEYLRILNNNPQLFYIKDLVRTSYRGDQVVSYQAYYLDGLEKEDAMRMRSELETAAQQALEQVDMSMDADQKALVVHDYLVQNCEYDQERLMAGTMPDISHTAYGALVKGMAVCDGYADAYAYIMEDKLGIPCTVVSSEPMNHAWNMIEIDGKWYHADLTWDDPVWDCIGRVNHNFFLLSDGRISQDSPDADTGNKNHYLWTSGYTADSVRYDQEFWTEVGSAICYYNGAWYYSRYQPEGRTVVLEKRNDLFASGGETIYEGTLWKGPGQSIYPKSYMYLSLANRKLYFNTRSAIMQMDAAGEIQSFCEPEDLAGMQIFGFTVRNNEFLYAPADTYKIEKQSDIRKYTLAKIEGITVKDVTGVYHGKPYEIEIQGILEGDRVQYALVDGTDTSYRETQPEMINAGIYRVRYSVEREDYAPFVGIATVTIAKAELEYTAPGKCMGKSGSTLADVALPEGFTWKNAKTKLRKEGEYTYPAVYTPEDSVNYKIVNLDITVKVTCPGHKWTSRVTKQPTTKEEGIRTYTCQYCGNSYTEKIDKIKETEKKTEEQKKEEGGTKNQNAAGSKKNKTDISQAASVSLIIKTCIYNGKKRTPAVVVRVGATRLTKNRHYTVSYQNNKNVGTAFLTVTGMGDYTGEVIKTFTILPQGTKILGGTKGKKRSLTVKWKKQTKSIDGYEIWCSTSRKYTKRTTIKKTAGKKAVKLTVKKLKAGKIYYVKVRTYKKVKGKKYYSPWSGERLVMLWK